MFRTPIKAMTLIALIFSSYALAQLTPEQEAAKKHGITLFNQYKTAEPELRIAAEAGDAEAQFYLGEELRLQNQRMTTESQKMVRSLSIPR